MGQIVITQTKSTIGAPKKVVQVLNRGLGLRKIGQTKTFKDNNCIRGMVNVVRHLVKYELKN